jgi:Zn-dependent protease
MLACPGCSRLVHGERLAALAQDAREATERGDVSAALAAWREARVLLPADSRQFQVISDKITELGKSLPLSGAAPPSNKSGANGSRVAAGAGIIGLILVNCKVLLVGLTKGTTLWTMLLSMGVYWSVWGWKFALGLVSSIYVHEIGHVIALRRYGFKSSAPTFIPGIGAFVRLQQQAVNPQEDADIGLAGPIYGLFAATGSLAIWAATNQPIFAAIAGVGAYFNLFNLIPIGPIDGGRGFNAMSRPQKFCATMTAAGAWLTTSDKLLELIALVCLARAAGDKPVNHGSVKSTLTYCLLIVTLAAMSMVRFRAGLEK